MLIAFLMSCMSFANLWPGLICLNVICTCVWFSQPCKVETITNTLLLGEIRQQFSLFITTNCWWVYRCYGVLFSVLIRGRGYISCGHYDFLYFVCNFIDVLYQRKYLLILQSTVYILGRNWSCVYPRWCWHPCR